MKAGQTSARKKKAVISLKELACSGLEKKVKLKNGKTVTFAEAMIDVLKDEIIRHHNTKAWELYRDICGQKPAEKVMMASVPTEIMDEVENMVAGYMDDEDGSGNGADDG